MMDFDPEQNERDDIEAALKSPRWAEAVSFLRTELTQIAPAIREAIAKGGEYGWCAPYHMGWGTGVRNLLREHGYGEQDFAIHNLDNIYIRLVEEAVKESTEQRIGENVI